jgi:hypothetical protein
MSRRTPSASRDPKLSRCGHSSPLSRAPLERRRGNTSGKAAAEAAARAGGRFTRKPRIKSKGWAGSEASPPEEEQRPWRLGESKAPVLTCGIACQTAGEETYSSLVNVGQQPHGAVSL